MTLPEPTAFNTLSDLILEQAAARPHLEVLLSEGRRWTYSALHRGVLRLAAELAGGGVKPGERVLLMAPTCDSFVVAFFALQYLGAIPVPLNPSLLEVEVIAHARDCQAHLLLADASTSDSIRETFIRACEGQVMRLDPRRQQLQWQDIQGVKDAVSYFDLPTDAAPEPYPADPDAVATILYTSGTTGNPKGVCLSHRNLLANARAIADVLPMAEFASTAIVLPLHHAYALTSQLLATLLTGGTAQLFRGLSFAFPVLQEIQREAIESFAGVPTTFRQLAALEDLDELDLACVRYVCTAGAPWQSADLELVRRIFPAARLYNNYGLTEAGPRVSMVCEDDPRFHEGSVGKPIAEVSVRVMTEGREAAPGEVGELEVRSPGVMRGYWASPTSSALTVDDGWLRTGDLARLDADGYLFVLGRQDEMLNRGCEKVSPVEIESVLVRHARVREAAVVGIEDSLLGERIVAWVVPDGQDFVPQDVLRHCYTHLARYKCPHEVRPVERLPRTQNGKLHKERLRSWSVEAATGAPAEGVLDGNG